MQVVLLLIVGVWLFIALLHQNGVQRREVQGDPEQGVVIFVEPVRWLFRFWGYNALFKALRSAGFQGRIPVFRWSSPSGSLLVLPDLVQRQRLQADAERLAAGVRGYRSEHPDVPISLVAYSSGCYVALEACRLLNDDKPSSPPVRQLILLAPSVSPTYPVESVGVESASLYYSPADVINAVGTTLFGSNDRRWGPPAGCVGFENPPEFVRQHRWRFRDIRYCWFGDHFTVASRRLLQEQAAPELLRHLQVSEADKGTAPTGRSGS